MTETRLVPIDIGDGLYVSMRRPSIFRNVLGFVSLFAGIVFRRYEDSRIGVMLALRIAWIVHIEGHGRRMKVWRRAAGNGRR